MVQSPFHEFVTANEGEKNTQQQVLAIRHEILLICPTIVQENADGHDGLSVHDIGAYSKSPA